MSPLSPRIGGIIAKHVALLLAGLLVGLLYGKPVVGVTVAALIATSWHVFHLCQLLIWLRAPLGTPIPPGAGPWPTVFSRIHHERQVVNKLRQRNADRMREWRSVTNALPDAGFILNHEFQIVQHNDTARRMFRIAGNDVLGLSITNIIRNPAFVQHLENDRFGEPVAIVPTADTSRTYSCKVTRYGSDQFLLMVRDVTKRRMQERMKADFVANASHELRTPLTVLRGYINSMAEDDEFDPNWREPVLEMSSQIERMHSLVTDLMQLNQLEVRLDAPLEPVAICAILEQACKDARQMSGGKINVKLDCEASTGLLGDASALRSVVTNLLSNAVRFTPPGGHVEVRWWTDQEGGHIHVRDSGIGIAETELQRITERFYRTDRGRARHEGGSGLGLAIVKHALSMHQATLTIDSEINEGSTFACHFTPARVTSASGDKLKEETRGKTHG